MLILLFVMSLFPFVISFMLVILSALSVMSLPLLGCILGCTCALCALRGFILARLYDAERSLTCKALVTMVVKGTLLWQLRCNLYIEDAIYSRLKIDRRLYSFWIQAMHSLCCYTGPYTPANTHHLVLLPRLHHSHNKYPTSVSYWCVRRRHRSCCGVWWCIIGFSHP